MNTTNHQKSERLPLPWRVLGFLGRLLISRVTWFILALLFFWLWRTQPVYTPDEALRIEQQRLLVEQQREMYERERLAILARVVGQTAHVLERETAKQPANLQNQPERTGHE